VWNLLLNIYKAKWTNGERNRLSLLTIIMMNNNNDNSDVGSISALLNASCFT